MVRGRRASTAWGGGRQDDRMLVASYFARQPILDDRGRVHAYELLYRRGPVPDAEVVDAEAATAEVLAAFFNEVDGSDVLGGRKGFVNLSRPLLVERVVIGFPPERLGVEILEDVTVDAEVVAAISEIRAHGFTVALDDFRPDDPRLTLAGISDIVKVDIMGLERRDIVRLASELRSISAATLLAEKVETRDEYEMCKEIGFSLFQGYYFARPQLVAGNRLDEGKDRMLHLLAEIHGADGSIDRIARAVESYPAIALQLLRLLNSAQFGLSRQVESIREAVVLLGVRRITEIATVLAIASHEGKPIALLALALTRARMCELLGGALNRSDASSFFTVGVLSVIDALTDRPLREVVPTLPLTDDVARALLNHDGMKGSVLDAAIAYERADWAGLPDLGLRPEVISEAYLDAIQWTSSMLDLVR